MYYNRITQIHKLNSLRLLEIFLNGKTKKVTPLLYEGRLIKYLQIFIFENWIHLKTHFDSSKLSYNYYYQVKLSFSPLWVHINTVWFSFISSLSYNKNSLKCTKYFLSKQMRRKSYRHPYLFSLRTQDFNIPYKYTFSKKNYTWHVTSKLIKKYGTYPIRMLGFK